MRFILTGGGAGDITMAPALLVNATVLGEFCRPKMCETVHETAGAVPGERDGWRIACNTGRPHPCLQPGDNIHAAVRAFDIGEARQYFAGGLHKPCPPISAEIPHPAETGDEVPSADEIGQHGLRLHRSAAGDESGGIAEDADQRRRQDHVTYPDRRLQRQLAERR